MPSVYGLIIKDGVNYSHDTAESISYDNTTSGLTADDIQSAIDELAASSGSGGHTIVNDAGTDMTQRTDLQFSGVYVSDEQSDDLTKVNIVRQLTKVQIEALSGEALKGFQECTTEESDLPLTSDVVECANNQSLTQKLSAMDSSILSASTATGTEYSSGVSVKDKIDTIISRYENVSVTTTASGAFIIPNSINYTSVLSIVCTSRVNTVILLTPLPSQSILVTFSYY